MKYLIGLIIALFLLDSHSAVDPKSYIPPKAFKYKETIKNEIERNFSNLVEYNYVPSLIEHESCISLTHSRCWEPTSRLKSAREEGAGLGQITRTFNEDGSVRFDSLADMARAHREELKELSWKNVYERPDLQIRTIVLMVRDIYGRYKDIEDPIERLKFSDAAYNGGSRDLNKQRMICKVKEGCNPSVWKDNVGSICVKSTKILYGNRSACDINKHHVYDVFENKLPKYKKQFFPSS